jgi:hypothetical protein
MTWIPVGIAAVDSIVALLGPLVPPGAAAIITLVKAGFASLSAVVAEYNADTNVADKATLLAKIRTLLKDIADNFGTFLNQLNLGTNPIVIIVMGLARIILNALAGFLGQLPAGPTAMATSVRIGNQTLTITPKYYKNVKDFKSDFNAVATINHHPEIALR